MTTLSPGTRRAALDLSRPIDAGALGSDMGGNLGLETAELTRSTVALDAGTRRDAGALSDGSALEAVVFAAGTRREAVAL